MRHSIYFVPESTSELHRLGSTWLGRDAFTGTTLNQPDQRLAACTSDPRRYGFHATLKPPFAVKQSVAMASFEKAVQALASQHKSFLTAALELVDIDGFLALVPQSHCTSLHNLAADCVQRLDDFRTPPDDTELRRRRAVGLSEQQETYLQRWGYPYVLDEFQFHMTLTNRINESERTWIMPLAQHHFSSVIGCPLLVDAISIVVEPEPQGEFQLAQRFPLVFNAMKAA